ncbi:guanylate kinase [bacterium]|nr:guanylate kinase [bacterium]
MIVLSGPAGSGKTTVAERIFAQGKVQRSVSATTRKPRQAETEGVDYIFLSEEEFRTRIADGDFLEHAQVHGNLYGTPRKPVEEAIAAGKTAMLVIDVQGAMQVKARFPGAFLVFLDAPDEATLAARLAGRNTEGQAEIERRQAAAPQERQHKEHYDAHVINDNLDRTVAELSAIIRSGR